MLQELKTAISALKKIGATKEASLFERLLQQTEREEERKENLYNAPRQSTEELARQSEEAIKLKNQFESLMHQVLPSFLENKN